MSILEKAIQACLANPLAFCKFISSNDAGATGAHQFGFYIPLDSWEILFDSPGVRGEMKDKFVTIKWQDDFETDTRFIYYGQKTRNEYRITRFGRGFPYLRDTHVGDLFVLVQISSEYYHGYVIDTDEDIEFFLSSLGLSASQTNRIIKGANSLQATSIRLEQLFNEFIVSLQIEFPDTVQMSAKAREIYQRINVKANREHPDSLLLKWLDIEYSLFKAIESNRYKERLSAPFLTVDELVDCANTLLNRRKSRAGKSLEHHLKEVFTINMLEFGTQVITEGNKKPDFIFPGGAQYHDTLFPKDKLVFLGAKTTCKDRWRQIINEADNIRVKHLFTLQQGISENQLIEMEQHQVVLVVPKQYIGSFPKSFHDKIMTLEGFISMVKNR
ncbi:type II restriction endonuclease [Cohnella mopanensis]|uniref:type II restriction endonuclease n=1 Tax=Cohnella mopanensis TaxID=2911966 RepID=UPI001EF754A0|nr:type II restriction endonuclease [Cohnella mopanensis]